MKKTLKLLAGAAILLSANAALADPTKEECIDANSKAQSLRMAGKSRAARDALRMCGSPTCPVMVRDDCQQRLDDLERVLPTVVFAAKDAAGHDLVSVKVTMDGETLAEQLGGAAIPVDIGEHEFAFEVVGKPIVKQRFVIREGEKARRESITIGESPAESQPPPLETTPPAPRDASPLPPPAKEEPVSRGTSLRVVGWSTAAVGLAGIGVGIVLGVVGNDANARVLTDCPAGGCVKGTSAYDQAVSDRNAAAALWTGMAVAFVAGGVALATGALLVLVAPTAKKPTAPTMGLVPNLFLGGGGATLTGRF